MRHALAALFAVIIALAPALAQAQTLTVELDAELEAPRSVEGTVRVQRGGRADAPVVIVRPPDDDRLDAPVRPAPVRAAPVVVAPPPAPPRTIVVQRVEGPPARDPEPELEGSAFFGLLFEGVDLSGGGLTLGDPEVDAIQGVELGPEGAAALRRPVLGGFTVGLGMRAAEFLRGPELRFSMVGGDTDADWFAAPGAPGFELSVRSVLMLRAELAIGLQVPLGPVTPYVLGRAAAGGAFVDVEVRHDELGGLGTETLELGVAQLGIEAGMSVEIEDGLELGFAYRSSFLGQESHGGMLTVGFHGE